MRISPDFRAPTLILVLALGGCVTPPWNTTPGPQRADKIGVTADLPAGWARYNLDAGLLFTRDGVLIQSVRVKRDKYGSRLENTDRTIAKGIEPHEAAQILIDAMMADQARHRLTVVDNRPATVSGHPGFRLEVTYKSTEGLTMRETLYVALTDDSYVSIRHQAPERHYHERSAGDFERIVAGIRIDEDSSKS